MRDCDVPVTRELLWCGCRRCSVVSVRFFRNQDGGILFDRCSHCGCQDTRLILNGSAMIEPNQINDADRSLRRLWVGTTSVGELASRQLVRLAEPDRRLDCNVYLFTMFCRDIMPAGFEVVLYSTLSSQRRTYWCESCCALHPLLLRGVVEPISLSDSVQTSRVLAR